MSDADDSRRRRPFSHLADEDPEDLAVIEFRSTSHGGWVQLCRARRPGGYTETGELFVNPDGYVVFRAIDGRASRRKRPPAGAGGAADLTP